MATYDLAYAIKKAAVDLFLFPASVAGGVLGWLSSNLVGFGLGFDAARGWYLHAYAVLDFPLEIQQFLRLQLPLVDVQVVVLSSSLQALNGGPIAPPAAALRIGIGAEIEPDTRLDFGTLCLFVQRQNVNSLLTCKHVLTGVSPAVLQRVGGVAGPPIARTSDGTHFVPGQGSPHAQPNTADFALATLDPAVVIDPTLPFGLGRLDPHVLPPSNHAPVLSAGRPPQRRGITFDSSADVKIDYPDGTFFFSDQILIQSTDGAPFAAPGDSGGLVVDTATPPHAIGMIFAGGRPMLPINPPVPPGVVLTAAVPLATLIPGLHVNLVV